MDQPDAAERGRLAKEVKKLRQDVDALAEAVAKIERRTRRRSKSVTKSEESLASEITELKQNLKITLHAAIMNLEEAQRLRQHLDDTTTPPPEAKES